MYAADNGYLAVVEWLVAHGADVTGKDNVRLSTLHTVAHPHCAVADSVYVSVLSVCLSLCAWV